ncbi:MAG TPA: hypothetical protein PLP23_19370 [Panacibacter sp.]|nr:hypothetical protein [Panacibacter sp.]
MFKKKNLSRIQLRLLEHALVRDLFPKPVIGELLVEDATNAGCTFYFKEGYYLKLISRFSEQVHTGTFARGDSEREWMDLVSAIQSASACDTIDISKLTAHILSIKESTKSITNSNNYSLKKIKILEQKRFLPLLPFGWEIIESLWKEILLLDGGSFEETADTIKLTTTSNKNITINKNNLEDNNSSKITYQGTFDEISSKKMLLVFNKGSKTFEILDPYFPDKSFKILFSLT